MSNSNKSALDIVAARIATLRENNEQQYINQVEKNFHI